MFAVGLVAAVGLNRASVANRETKLEYGSFIRNEKWALGLIVLGISIARGQSLVEGLRSKLQERSKRRPKLRSDLEAFFRVVLVATCTSALMCLVASVLSP